MDRLNPQGRPSRLISLSEEFQPSSESVFVFLDPLWSRIIFVLTHSDLLHESPLRAGHARRSSVSMCKQLFEALFSLNGFVNPTLASSLCCGMSLAGLLGLDQPVFVPPEYCPDARLLIYCVGISIPLNIPRGCRALIRCLTPALNCCGRESTQDRKWISSWND